MRATSKLLILSLWPLLFAGCNNAIDSQAKLERYYSSINSLDYSKFKSVVHPILIDELKLTEEVFLKQLEDSFISDRVIFDDVQILHQYTDTASVNKSYAIVAYSAMETHSFSKGSRMRIFYRNLQEGAIGQDVDQASIKVHGDENKITFVSSHFALFLKAQDEEEFKIIPKCSRRLFKLIFGEEEGNTIFNTYDRLYRSEIKPGL